MGTKLALNFIWNGIKKVLKSLEFNLEDPGGTLLMLLHLKFCYFCSRNNVVQNLYKRMIKDILKNVGNQTI